MGDRLLDFVDDPANATFGGSSGMGDDMISGPRHAGKSVTSYVAKALPSDLLCEQLVNLGRSQGEKGRNVTILLYKPASTAFM
ncbi:MAG: hypothetical protein AB2693_24940 [Candidatus Thiodiazotropha sp.]